MKYDFHNLLSYIDFEELSRDILQQKEGFILKSFKEGKDDGIDFRIASVENNNSIIIQCKNYKDDFPYLFRELEKEVKKVKKLNPTRYIVMTSVGLTPANTEKIKNLFHQYILTTDDIYGKDDINNLLGHKHYKDIERKHYKLWLSSTNILQSIINKDIINKSEGLLLDISDTAEKFVYSEAYNLAKDLLQKYNFCIISGNPGVGKTSLSQMLSFSYLLDQSSKWYIYDITKNIEDAHKIFDKNINQVFYINDFLGSNSLKLSQNKNEEHDLISLVKKVKKSKNKKLILNTREYILQQAKFESDIFEENNLEISKHVLNLNDYTKTIRAEILYNHLYFSNLSKEYINEITKNKRYKEIIKHKKFHPRVIDHLTQIEKVEDVITPDNYYTDFMKALNNPSYIWEKIFVNDKVSWEAKTLIYILPFFDNPRINNSNFTTKYRHVYNKLASHFKFNKIELSLEKAVQETDYIIKIEHQKIIFYDPSILDFAKEHIFKDYELLMIIIKSLDIFHPPYKSASLTLIRKNKFSFKNENHQVNALIESYFIEKFTEYSLKLRDLEFLNRSVLSSNETLAKKIRNIFFKKLEKYQDDKELDLLDASEIENLLSLIETDFERYPSYDIDINYNKLLTISLDQVEGNDFVSSALHNIYEICNREKSLFNEYKEKINNNFISTHIQEELKWADDDENLIGYLEDICDLYYNLFDKNPSIKLELYYYQENLYGDEDEEFEVENTTSIDFENHEDNEIDSIFSTLLKK